MSIAIVDDDLLEDSESFFIELQATGIRFSAPDQQRIDIIDNDGIISRIIHFQITKLLFLIVIYALYMIENLLLYFHSS